MARFVVQEFERLVVLTPGAASRVLEPGVHRFRLRRRIDTVRLDVRPSLIKINSQEVLTADGVAVRGALVVEFRIQDPLTWTRASTAGTSPADRLYLAAQMAMRDFVAAATAEELLRLRATASAALTATVETVAADVGAKLGAVHLRDLTFPGELKAMFAQVAAAKQESAAALERARGEQARLRSLANAARLLDGNPSLRDLRTLDTVERSKGTVVLHTSGAAPAAT